MEGSLRLAGARIASEATMTENTSTLTDVNPLDIVKGADETDGEFVRVEYTAYPSPDAPHAETALPHARWAADIQDEHVNPKIKETFKVLSGELQVVAGEQEQLLTEGDEITISGRYPHRHWNPSEKPARIRYEARPALHMDEALETAFVLAQAGKADEHGNPDLLPLAVFQDAYPDHFYSTDLPILVQKVLFKVLAPIGRLAGYRATYSREDIADLR